MYTKISKFIKIYTLKIDKVSLLTFLSEYKLDRVLLTMQVVNN